MRMDYFFHSFFFRIFFLLEQSLSEFFSLCLLINMIIVKHEQSALNTNATQNQIELKDIHELVDQTEHELKLALSSNLERNEQLNILLDRTDLLLQKNQAFGIGVTDYRQDFQRHQSMHRLKYIIIGILVFAIVILLIILNVILNRTKNLSDRNRNNIVF